MSGVGPRGRVGGRRELDRRAFLRLGLVAGGVALAGALGTALYRLSAREEGAGCDHAPHQAVDIQEGAIRGTGIGRDSIPSIDRPRFVSAQEASAFVEDSQVVFGLEAPSGPRAYPQQILVWHEVVNDWVGGAPVAVTYCPLTGSQVAFRGVPAPGADPVEFGTTGRLVNSNLLMYDRATESDWPQISGQAVRGPLRGAALEREPLVWTTWGRWRDRHPDTPVLSTDTGFVRNYRSDPYGSYDPLGGYYRDESVRFPVVCRDHRFRAKRVFLGLAGGRDAWAVDPVHLRDVRVANLTLCEEPVAVLYDERLDAGRAFQARRDGTALDLHWDGTVVDGATGSRWSPEGVALEGPLAGTRLPEIPSMNVMWFAWAAFHPWTRVLASS